MSTQTWNNSGPSRWSSATVAQTVRPLGSARHRRSYLAERRRLTHHCGPLPVRPHQQKQQQQVLQTIRQRHRPRCWRLGTGLIGRRARQYHQSRPARLGWRQNSYAKVRRRWTKMAFKQLPVLPRRGNGQRVVSASPARVSWARRLSWVPRPNPWPGPNCFVADAKHVRRNKHKPTVASDVHCHCCERIRSTATVCGPIPDRLTIPEAIERVAHTARHHDIPSPPHSSGNGQPTTADLAATPSLMPDDPNIVRSKPTNRSVITNALSSPQPRPRTDMMEATTSPRPALRPPSPRMIRVQHTVIYCLLYLLLLVPKPCRGLEFASSDQQQFRCPETCNYDTPEMPTFEEFCSRPRPPAKAAVSAASSRAVRADPGGATGTVVEYNINPGKPSPLPTANVDKSPISPGHQIQFKEFKELTRKPPRLREPPGKPQEAHADLPTASSFGSSVRAETLRTPLGETQTHDDRGDGSGSSSSTGTETLPHAAAVKAAHDDTPNPTEAAGGHHRRISVRAVDPLDEGAGDGGGHLPRLRICEHISPEMLLDRKRFCNASLEERSKMWNRLWHEDRKACETVCQMEKLFDRFDCNLRYSVRWSCKHCQDSYREWTCAMRLPIFHPMTGELWKPCRSLCTDVEERCPHFHPIQGEAYAGEPLFYCIDPNIPEPDEVSPYAPDGRCYLACWLKEYPKARLPEKVSNTDLLSLISSTNKDDGIQTPGKSDIMSSGRLEKDRVDGGQVGGTLDIETTSAALSLDGTALDTNTEPIEGDNSTTERDYQDCPAIDWLVEDPSLESISVGNRHRQSASSAASSTTRGASKSAVNTSCAVYVALYGLLLRRAPWSGRSFYDAFCTVVSAICFCSVSCVSRCFHSATT